jgi:hypothetical protein
MKKKKLPRKMTDFASQKEILSGKKLPDEKKIFDKDTFKRYVQTFQEFLRSDEVEITKEQQEKIIQS